LAITAAIHRLNRPRVSSWIRRNTSTKNRGVLPVQQKKAYPAQNNG
jgi:hypothetical protein